MTIRCSEVILPLRSEPSAMVAITSPLGCVPRTTSARCCAVLCPGEDASHAAGQRLFASCLRRKVYTDPIITLFLLGDFDFDAPGGGAAPGTAIGRIRAGDGGAATRPHSIIV